MFEYAENGVQLVPICRTFYREDFIDFDLIEKVMAAAQSKKDHIVLAEILLLVGQAKDANKDTIVPRFVVPCLEQLIDEGDRTWIQRIWFDDSIRKIIAELDDGILDRLLSSFVDTKEITHQFEDLLENIAEINPQSVLRYLEKRLIASREDRSIHAIPFSFNGLENTLSQHTDLLLETVKKWGGMDSVMLRFEGGRLIANTFPEFDKRIQKALEPYASSGNESDARLVLSILGNYNGQPSLLETCRLLIIHSSELEFVRSGISSALYNTGVVSGEYGIANAYENKAEALKPWLEDKNPEVVSFAEELIESLLASAKRDRERADEYIALRKHEYGIKEEE